MSELILVKPSEEHLDELLSFKREFTGRGERVAETCTELSALLAGYNRSRDGIGRSQSAVYRFARGEDVRYLKVAELSNEIRRERDLIAFLKGRLPVPELLFYGEEDGHAFLLMGRAEGAMACEGLAQGAREPAEQTVKALAKALNMLQEVNAASCPYQNTLERKLEQALFNIEHGLVNINDFEQGNDFASPMDLYRWLAANRPHEEPCFTHGDFCLPNIFVRGGEVTGFIDWGRGGIADKWQDIALCVRSLGYNLGQTDPAPYVKLLFSHLGLEPDEAKLRYYILLDELF